MGAWRKAVGVAAMLGLLAGCASHQSEGSTEWRLRKLEEHALAAQEQALQRSDREQQAEARLDALEGRVDGLAKSQKDLEAMLSDLSASRPSIAPAAPAAQARAAEPAMTTAPKPADKPAAKPAAAAPAKAGSGAQAEYDRALATLRAGKPEEARTRFEAFLASWPKSDLAANARYWIGESYYNQNRHADAVISFRQVHQEHPKHAKAAAALLKMGMSYQKLGDAQNARFYWEALLADYPQSEPAGLARKMLSTLKK
ncbi:MAG: tol-pal system protein YbgF [Thermodesulfobacteriota bacterium]